MNRAVEIARSVRAGEVRAEDIVDAALDAAARDEHGAFVFLDESARERASQVTDGPLAGVPVALKANIAHEGWPSDCGSKILAGWRSPYHATVTERLLAAGAVPIGLTNMDEFAMGSSTEHSCHGPTRNPRAPERIPGGSSGGSAAAVAASIVPIALGSDTGGSVRQPAALCGVLGFKPTYGRVSRYGLIAYGSSLDQVASFAANAEDLALVSSVLSGHDPRDATSREVPALKEAPRLRSIEGLRVGILTELLGEGVDEDVRAAIEAAADRFREAGAKVERVSLPSLAYSLPTYYVLAAAEASSNLGRYDGLRYGARVNGEDLTGTLSAGRGEGFGPEVQRRILLGTHVLSAGYRDAWYDRAAKVRRKITGEFDAAFEGVDLLLSPTAPGPAWKLREKMDDPLAMYAADLCTVPQNLAGLPAVSVPAGEVTRDGESLPIGLQITGPALHDEVVLGAAASWEELR